MLEKIPKVVFRNEYSIRGTKSSHKKINLEWWNAEPNVGDCLAPAIYQWLMEYFNLDGRKCVGATQHLLTVGSLVGMGRCDAVIWGSGVHCVQTTKKIINQRMYRKYDVRAVRGPITKLLLESAGYDCPDIYGDPAILMPLIYEPNCVEKKYRTSLILHLSQHGSKDRDDKEHHLIDVKTNDYKKFINEIVASEVVISSSLHGIILAESYGVPAIFLKKGIESETMKFFDWYYSTERFDIVIANSINDAMKMTPMKLPELKLQREVLMRAFPVDLWN